MSNRPLPFQPSELLAAVLSASADLIVVVDTDGVLRYSNGVGTRMLGTSRDERLGMSLFDIIHSDDHDVFTQRLAYCDPSLAAEREAFMVRVRHVDGHWVPLEVSGVEHIEEAGVTGVVFVARDVTARMDAQERLRRVRDELGFAESHDALTQLPNRTGLKRGLEAMQQTDGPPPLLMMVKVADYDGLHERYGAQEAESIHQTLGWTVRAEARPSDFVAVDRRGEFVVVIESPMSTAELNAYGSRLLALADTPLTSRRRRADIQLVLGMTTMRPGLDVHTTLDQLTQAAHLATRTGATTPVVYNEHMRGGRSELCRQAADVERGLAAGEFELFYQPIRDIRSARVASFEGLLRWHHPTDGLVTAGRFLPAVEGTAVMIDIGELVLEAGCAQLAHWQRRFGAAAPSLALNVSARQLRQGDFATQIAAAIGRSGIDAAGLCLELTETHALEQEASAFEELQRVRALGVAIALDDFGTGYSSLQHLQKLGADVLKIDRSFVCRLADDDGAAAIVKAAIDLGAAFGTTTVAEGVTTVEEYQLLRGLGCDRIQGFLIAEAIPGDGAEAMIVADQTLQTNFGQDDVRLRTAVVRARRDLMRVDRSYTPSDYEVAAVAGVTAAMVRHVLAPQLEMDEHRATAHQQQQCRSVVADRLTSHDVDVA